MYQKEVYIKDFQRKTPHNPQFIYTGKNAVLEALEIDLELTLFAVPPMDRKYEKVLNGDTITITFDSMYQKTVYTIPNK